MAHEAHACRFWCAIGDKVPARFVNSQLLEAPNSLKQLGEEYQDGWAVGYYSKKEPFIARGAETSLTDLNYDQAVRETAAVEADIIIGHLRRASSGCVEGVPNPHPFIREKMGKTWIFGHNGGMKKQILIDLIGEEYLTKNKPEVCDHAPPKSWIDSELYFIYLLKMIEQSRGDVEQGINAALSQLYAILGEGRRYLNFFLSDGMSIWAFRKGTSLYYLMDDKLDIAAVTSTVPDDKYNWVEFPNNTLARLQKGRRISFYKPIAVESMEMPKRLLEDQGEDALSTSGTQDPTMLDTMIHLYETRN